MYSDKCMNKRNHSRSLSKKQIIDTAFSLADEVGPEKITMHAIASKLYITTAGLYTYFESRDEIIECVYAHYFSDIDCQRIPGEFWLDTLKRKTTSYKHAIERHPLIAFAYGKSEKQPRAGIRYQQKWSAIFEEQGVDPYVIGHSSRVIRSLVMSYLTSSLAVQKTGNITSRELSSEWTSSAFETFDTCQLSDMFDDALCLARSIAGPASDYWFTPSQPQDKNGAAA